jgi:hypothetical protein
VRCKKKEKEKEKEEEEEGARYQDCDVNFSEKKCRKRIS